ncbi:6-O-methylguanine DNA methyltransferase [Chlamydoabsidia padenii]|nr:6-O-methylguanine DNA methyltransferase [Chlamydoabsidia padenii]
MTITRRSKTTTTRKSPYFNKKEYVANDEDITSLIVYPLTPEERSSYINPNTKRKLTKFHYQVYDLVAKIPKGQVTTYKAISDALGSHPRAVGQALRINPFAPLPIPCHRVIMTNKAIGGFNGGFGNCQFVANKKAKLAKEGVVFDNKNILTSNSLGDDSVFDDFIQGVVVDN